MKFNPIKYSENNLVVTQPGEDSGRLMLTVIYTLIIVLCISMTVFSYHLSGSLPIWAISVNVFKYRWNNFSDHNYCSNDHTI